MLFFSLKYNIDVLNNLCYTLLDTLHGIRASESICLCHSVRHRTPASAFRTFRVSRLNHSTSLSHPARVSPSTRASSISHSTSLSHPARVSHSASRLSHSARASHLSYSTCLTHSASRASSASSSPQRHPITFAGREWSGWRRPGSAANRIQRDRLPPSVQKGTPL